MFNRAGQAQQLRVMRTSKPLRGEAVVRTDLAVRCVMLGLYAVLLPLHHVYDVYQSTDGNTVSD